jgi:hypothetical protein
MRENIRSHPWLTAGFASLSILVVAVTFIGFAAAPNNVEPPQPNALGPYGCLSTTHPAVPHRRAVSWHSEPPSRNRAAAAPAVLKTTR